MSTFSSPPLSLKPRTSPLEPYKPVGFAEDGFGFGFGIDEGLGKYCSEWKPLLLLLYWLGGIDFTLLPRCAGKIDLAMLFMKLRLWFFSILDIET
jgi:hypothetical protein